MRTIDFVFHDATGALQHGLFQAANDQEISLNLRQADMQGHARNSNALNIVLADGRVIIIENYFFNDSGAISYTQNGSTRDPSNSHGLSLIHRVSDTPLSGGFSGLTTEDNAGDIVVAQVNDNGSIADLASTTTAGGRAGETQVNLANDVPDGSQPIVTSTDANGKMASAYVVLDYSTANATVDLSNGNLGNYEINSGELAFADAARLTITEAQLLSLFNTSDTLTIHGHDDTVNIIGTSVQQLLVRQLWIASHTTSSLWVMAL